MSTVRLGVALSGGSFFGIAHIGVLQALEESGIRPDVITGASAGALVAGLYAARVPLDDTALYARHIGQRPLRALGLDLGGMLLSLFGRPLIGLCTGDPLIRRIRSLTGDPMLSELPVPFGCTVYDLSHHALRLYGSRPAPGVRTDGRLADLLRASVSFPGILRPVREPDGTLLMDGGVADDLPVGLCRRLGADVVIAVSLGPQPLPPRPRASDVAATAVLATTANLARATQQADLWLTPDLSGLRAWHPDPVALIARGAQAVRDRLEEVTALRSRG